MNLKDKVCTKEQAMKFRELGVSQKGQHVWAGNVLWSIPDDAQLSGFSDTAIAFDACELHALIPSTIHVPGTTDYLDWASFKRDHGRVDVIVYKNAARKTLKCFGFNPYAASLAELLLWFLEKEYISVADINCVLSSETATSN